MQGNIQERENKCNQQLINLLILKIMTQTTKQTDYQKQATDFLEQAQTSFFVKYLKTGKHFEDDKEERDIYEITLKRKSRSYTFQFGQSLNNSGFYYQYRTGRTKIPLDRKYLAKDYFKGKALGLIGTIKMKDSSFVPNLDILHYPKEPTAYDVLACLQKCDPGTFEDFCSEFGYDTDSRKAEKIYKAVVNEWQNVAMLFTDKEIEQLQEIQ